MGLYGRPLLALAGFLVQDGSHSLQISIHYIYLLTLWYVLTKITQFHLPAFTPKPQSITASTPMRVEG